MDWKTYYCYDVNTTQSDLQNPNDVQCQNRKIHSKTYLESQGTLNILNNLEKEGQSQRSEVPDFKPYFIKLYTF